MTGFRLGGVLDVLRQVGAEAVQFLESRPWTFTEDAFLGCFEFARVDPEMIAQEEKAWRNFLFWLKSVVSKYELYNDVPSLASALHTNQRNCVVQ